MRIKVSALVGAVLFTAASAAQASPVYNALADFSIAANPNSPWAYGEGVGGASFSALSNAFVGGFTGNPDFEYWQSANQTYEVPLVAKNIGSSTIDVSTLISPNNVLLIHPGVSTDVIVQWTAPTAGLYTYAGLYELLDTSPTGVVGEVFANNLLVYAGALTGPGANQSTNTPGQPESFGGIVALNAGGTLSFVVNNAGDVFNDSTGFNATITAAPEGPAPVPEPVTISLFGVGLAGAAALRRRKRFKTT